MCDYLVAAPTETCIWMDAGVLTYRLCDRRFDCEHCPLDSAIRGRRVSVARELPALSPHGEPSIAFPTDRNYSEGHTWCQAVEGQSGRFRFGLDSFAAALIAPPRRVHWTAASGINRAETVCAIEFDDGVVHVGSPLSGRLVGANHELDEDPGILTADPYRRGWIAELAQVHGGEVADLLSAQAAWEQTRLDLRRLRRLVAFHLLADESGDACAGALGGEAMADARRMLAHDAYLKVVDEILHQYGRPIARDAALTGVRELPAP